MAIKKIKKDILQSKEERLLKGSLLKFGDHIKPKDLSEIMFLLFRREYIDNINLSWRNRWNKEITYNTNGRKSGNFNSRSVEDAFRICRNYIPTITYKQVDEIINQLKTKRVIIGNFCTTCRRVVYGTVSMKPKEDSFIKGVGDLNIKIN